MLERLALRLLVATFFVVCALSLVCNTAPRGNAKGRETRSNPEPANAKPSSAVEATNVKATFHAESTNVKSNSHAESRDGATSSNVESTNVTPNIQQTNSAIYEGFLDEADCKTIWGWVWNKNQKPDEVVSVDIWAGGSLIATIRADQHRWSVAPHTGDKGNHGYVYTVPPALKNGRPHVITVKVARTNFELHNSPKTIKCSRREESMARAH